MSTFQTTETEPTVKDLVIAAGQLGHKIAAVAPDAWATSTKIDRTLGQPWIIHSHEITHDAYLVRISHAISNEDHGVDVQVIWDQVDGHGNEAAQYACLDLSGVPELIEALQAALRAVEEPAKVLRRPANVDAELQRLDA